jgi:hypothetical protein
MTAAAARANQRRRRDDDIGGRAAPGGPGATLRAEWWNTVMDQRAGLTAGERHGGMTPH